MKYLPEPGKESNAWQSGQQESSVSVYNGISGGNLSGIELESAACRRGRECSGKRDGSLWCNLLAGTGHEYTPQPFYVDVTLNISPKIHYLRVNLRQQLQKEFRRTADVMLH